MFKKNKIIAIMAAVMASVGMVQPAKAGLRDWLNDMTTFNEDQKRPFHKYPTTPRAPQLFYDSKTGDDWSQFYTGNTQAQPYLNGSATMVVRPAAAALPAPSALGYDVFARRNYLNNNQPTGQVMIGEPGMAADMAAGSDGRIAMAAPTNGKTIVGNPKDWRSDTSGPRITARPGDFDYREGDKPSMAVASSATDGFKRGDMPPVTGPMAAVNPAYNGDGSTRYTVERGDSLSGISDKPKIYGDWKLWPLLYDANRGTIGHDPDFIKPGQNLGVPRDVVELDAHNARHTANAKKPPHALHDGR